MSISDALDLIIPADSNAITQVSIWASVTQASPLRVHLDGDPGPLPFAPDTLVNGLQVGNRVLVFLTTNNKPETRSRRVVVVGKSDGVPIPTVTPAGVYVPFAGASVPAGGWLLCDGASYLRADYPALFAAIGTIYGALDGTHFNVPDMRGLVPVGRHAGQAEFDTLGESGGSRTHTLVESEMPSHTHTQNSHNHTQNAHNHGVTDPQHNHLQNIVATNGPSGITTRADYQADTNTPNFLGQAGNSTNNSATGVTVNNATATNQSATATNQNTGGGGAHNNLQPYRVGNYIIKT